MPNRIRPWILAAVVAATAVPSTAGAFCGFYVSGAGAKLFNDATQVVVMREGTRTVLSMQNSYKGPPQNFAMVVPVPVVLQKENVKTLPRELFARLDTLTAPRLVEYWEQDPCAFSRHHPIPKSAPRGAAAPPMEEMAEKRKDLGVKIEAQFTVGEYEVVVLSAKDSGGLDTWLRRENYTIPEGAEPYLRPYVLAGSKFFVAKVNVAKVKFEQGRATLSPLRFHYDTDTFSLPIRLGLMNSGGTQDLIVHVVARGQRYEVANYPNAAIPTNFDVGEGAKSQFGAFYAALFDRTIAKIPKAVVTEYAWDAGSCDPCPSPPLDESEIATLGADVLPIDADAEEERPRPRGRKGGWGGGGGFVVTRLHARYGKDSLGEDLVFRAADPIVGGRETSGERGKLEHGATPGSVNNFQGRYAIRHPWTGPVACKNPLRGLWGGPPNGAAPPPSTARDLAFVPRGKLDLASVVRGPLPDVIALPGAVTPLGSPVVPVKALAAPEVRDAGVDAVANDAGAPPGVGPVPPPAKRGCGCEVPGGAAGSGGAATTLGLLVAWIRRRRRRA